MRSTILEHVSGIFKHVSWLYAFIFFFTCANVNVCAQVKKRLLVRKVKNESSSRLKGKVCIHFFHSNFLSFTVMLNSQFFFLS